VPSGNEASGPYNSQGFYVTPGPDYLPSYDYTGGSAPAATYDNSYAPSAYPDDYPWYGNDPFWGDDFFFLGGFGDHRDDHDHGRNARAAAVDFIKSDRQIPAAVEIRRKFQRAVL
jgi:hypothetical protein